MESQSINNSNNKSGSKAIDRIAEIPIVNTAISCATDYYDKVKQTNMLLRTSCNLAEMSFKTMAFAATPITTLCKRPIETVDSFFYERVDALENAYPVLSKPTEVLASQAKDIYDNNVKKPIEQFYVDKERKVDELKTYGSNKVTSVVKAGAESIDSWRLYGFGVVDQVLENRFAKILTEPMLNLTEKTVDYWLPPVEDVNSDDHRTLRRIYDINNRVYKHLYQTTFNQLSRLHAQFELVIQRLMVVNHIAELVYAEGKDRLNTAFKTAADNSLVKRCVAVIDKNNLSLVKLNEITRGYYTVILTEATKLIDKYMSLVQNFPLVFNGTRIKQTIENLRNQFTTDSFAQYSRVTIENLRSIHQALLGYTNQMFQVVNDSRIMQLLKRMPSQANLKANYLKNNNSSNHNNNQQSQTQASAILEAAVLNRTHGMERLPLNNLTKSNSSPSTNSLKQATTTTAAATTTLTSDDNNLINLKKQQQQQQQPKTNAAAATAVSREEMEKEENEEDEDDSDDVDDLEYDDASAFHSQVARFQTNLPPLIDEEEKTSVSTNNENETENENESITPKQSPIAATTNASINSSNEKNVTIKKLNGEESINDSRTSESNTTGNNTTSNDDESGELSTDLSNTTKTHSDDDDDNDDDDDDDEEEDDDEHKKPNSKNQETNDDEIEEDEE